MVALLVSWLPFIVLVSIWFPYARRSGMQARGPSGASMLALYEQQVEETRRMNATLDWIALALEQRAKG